MNKKTVIFVVAALFVGMVLGWILGRTLLEQEWENPLAVITQADESRAAANDADPTPKAGTKVLPRIPLRRARARVAKMVEKDPMVMTVGTVGTSDDGSSLHMQIKNQGACEVSAYRGVAYTYDAWGKPVKANKNGETYMAFSAEKQKIAKGELGEFSAPSRYTDTASLVVAHVDAVDCADGTKWTRQ